MTIFTARLSLTQTAGVAASITGDVTITGTPTVGETLIDMPR